MSEKNKDNIAGVEQSCAIDGAGCGRKNEGLCEENYRFLEISDAVCVDILEIPRSCGVGPGEFFKSTDDVGLDEISKPYPNEHSCPHAAAGKFDRFRRGSRSHNGKQYGVIYGRVRGTNRWEEASYRYPVSAWSADDARKHCKSHQGVAFEQAVSKSPESHGAVMDIKKKDGMRHLVYGIVLEPGVPDLQGDFEVAEEVEKSAHRYLAKMWGEEKPSLVGAEHEYPIVKAIPVESFIAPCDFWYDGSPHDEEHKVRKGSWVVVSLIEDDEEFNNVRLGIYRGYSMQGLGNRKTVS